MEMTDTQLEAMHEEYKADIEKIESAERDDDVSYIKNIKAGHIEELNPDGFMERIARLERLERWRLNHE